MKAEDTFEMIRFSGVLVCLLAFLCVAVHGSADEIGIWEVEGPDGSVYDVEAPVGMSDKAVIEAVRQHIEREEKSYLERVRQKQWEAKQPYVVELSNNDELFIINGEKFEARTYCFNIYEGDEVVFLEGSALGVCVSAEILNLRTNDKCSLWCE